MTRRHPTNYRIIIIMTRWHEDDLIGRIKKNFSDDWYVYDVPAIPNYDEPEEKWRSFLPRRFPIDELKAQRKL